MTAHKAWCPFKDDVPGDGRSTMPEYAVNPVTRETCWHGGAGGPEVSAPKPAKKARVVKRKEARTKLVFGWTCTSANIIDQRGGVHFEYAFTNCVHVSVIKSEKSLGGSKGYWEVTAYLNNAKMHIYDSDYMTRNPEGWLTEIEVFQLLHYLARIDTGINYYDDGTALSKPGKTGVPVDGSETAGSTAYWIEAVMQKQRVDTVDKGDVR